MVQLTRAHIIASVTIVVALTLAGYLVFSESSPDSKAKHEPIVSPDAKQQNLEQTQSAATTTTSQENPTVAATTNSDAGRPSPADPSGSIVVPASGGVFSPSDEQSFQPAPPQQANELPAQQQQQPATLDGQNPQTSPSSLEVTRVNPDSPNQTTTAAQMTTTVNTITPPVPQLPQATTTTTTNSDQSEPMQRVPAMPVDSPNVEEHQQLERLPPGGASSATNTGVIETSDIEMTQWREFTSKYLKKYPNQDEESRRRDIFIGNSRFIRAFNEQSKALFRLGVNHFADLTRDEINQIFIGPQTSWKQTINQTPPAVKIIPDTLSNNDQMHAIDWRPLLGPPVDQGICRESAVFATISSIEAALNQLQSVGSTNFTPTLTQDNTQQQQQQQQMPKVKLSEQQILDCLSILAPPPPAWPPVCQGIWSMSHVFEFLSKQGLGLMTQQQYDDYKRANVAPDMPAGLMDKIRPPMAPPTAAACAQSTSSGSNPSPKVGAHVAVPKDNIQEALQNTGPLVVALDASQPTFHFYSEGIYHESQCSTDSYNLHALLVGYFPPSDNSTTTKESVYLLRASFGTDWGEAGHMRMLNEPTSNKCLPQNLAIYPNVAPVV